MQYNRTLDYTVLALDSLRKGNHVLAARLLAKAGEQTDLTAAIQILEHSNKVAHLQAQKLKASASAPRRLKAAEEEYMEEEQEGEEPAVHVEEAEFEEDPLDEVVEEEHVEEPVPAKTMAAVLQKMVRKTK